MESFKNFLQERKSVILGIWFETVIKTYPADTRTFLQKKENTFTNPIGSTIYEVLGVVLTEIVQDRNLNKIKESLEELIHLRAVQDFTPGQAISFLPSLKQIIKRELSNANLMGAYHEEYDNFSLFLDELTMQAFDIYMGCREKIFNLKIKELKRIINF